jgi:hypothetical protein
VTAVDSNSVHASISDHNQFKDIAAPGIFINSTYNESDTSTKYLSGTSMAAPFVSGIAALVFAKTPTLTPTQVQNALYSTATDLGDTIGRDNYYGYGLVNAQAALASVSKASSLPDFNNMIVTISSALASDKNIDIPGQSTADLTQPIIWSKGHGPNQRFKMVGVGGDCYTIVNIKSNKALDVTGGITSNNTKVIQYTQNGGKNQQWRLIQNPNGSYTLLSEINEDVALTVAGSNSTNGTGLVIYARSANAASQQFLITPVTDRFALGGTHTIQSVASNRLVDITGNSLQDSAPAIAWDTNGGLNQRFVFTYNSQTGYYTIRSASSNKMLDVYGNSLGAGIPIIQYASNGGFNQQWDPVQVSSGVYCFFSANSNMVLDLKGGSIANGTPLITWTYHGGTNQQWKLN